MYRGTQCRPDMQRGSSPFEVFMASNLGRNDKEGTAKDVDATSRFTVQGSQWTPTPP